MTCRCGFNGTGNHPCHGRLYTCRKPATQRLYGAHLTALAGVQPKVGVHETWACEECWAEYGRESVAVEKETR